MPWPNLFIIGAAKCGTTSLHQYLDVHPEIGMSVEKEPNFFSLGADGPGDALVVRTESRYLRLFDATKHVRGEASVSYSFWPYPEGVPERISRVVPDAKFIYLVRDPVERVFSHYRHRVAMGEETRSMSDVIASPNEPAERYVTASSYAVQLKQYLQFFDIGQFLVVDVATLAPDQIVATMQSCFRFLGVDPDSCDPTIWHSQFNQTDKQLLYGKLANRIRFSRPYRATLSWVPPGVRARVVGPVRSALTRRVEVQRDFPDWMARHYQDVLRSDTQEFRRLTGLRFADWSI